MLLFISITNQCSFPQKWLKPLDIKCSISFLRKMPTAKHKASARTKADRMAERQRGSESSESSEEVYEVEAILKKRFRGDVEQYLVKWKGYPENQATWEPKAHMTDCASLILEFELTQLPQQARDDLAESEESFRPSSDPLPPSLYEHNLNAVMPGSTLSACRGQLAFLRQKTEQEAVLQAHEQVGEVLECERGDGVIWFGVRLTDGQLRRVRKEELMKSNKLKLVQYYEQLIRWSN